ncbi:unnamed protein product [Urochloa decumbens]|uniref:Glycosyltransferase n=1 Tax=Urochloa decumbens TaxID=240449 RepID=A0ABC9FRB3_9POAL
MAKPKLTVVLLPVWSSGHFTPALEAGKRLVSALGCDDFSLTVLVMRPPTPESASQVATHMAGEAAAESATRGGCEVIFHHLPAVEPPAGCDTVEVFTSRYIHLHAPLVRATVAALPAAAAALVVEFTSTGMFDVARELGVPAYVYFASSAAMLALMLRLPALHDEAPEEFGEQQRVRVPGLPRRSSSRRCWRRSPRAGARVDAPRRRCTRSARLGFLTAEQVSEAAAGLERSGQRFLWALRAPPAAAGELRLPEGFLERTKDRGLVWTSWAPQREVLAHRAVGGFVTHCGWNLVLQALWSGVPMAPWPLYAEQHLNAFEIVASMGVAVRMDVDRKRNNFVEAGEVARVVRCLVRGDDEEEDGRRARKRVAEMRGACHRTVVQGGSSHASLHGAAAAVRHRLEDA